MRHHERKVSMKRISALLLGLLMMVTTLGVQAIAAESIDINYMCIWAPDFVSPPQTARKVLLEEYKKAWPNVNYIDNSVNNEDYIQKITQLSISDDLPDLFMVNGALLSMLVDAEQIVPVSEYYKNRPEWQAMIPEELYNDFTYKGVAWCVPYQRQASTFLYWNKSIFKECGVEAPPKTVSELIEMAPKFLEKGYYPIGYGSVIPQQYNNCVLNTMMPCYVDDSFVVEMFDNRGPDKTFLDKEGVLRAYQDLYAMGAAKCFNPDICTITENEAYMLFAQGKCAMTGYGGWAGEWMVLNCDEAMLADGNIGVTYWLQPDESTRPADHYTVMAGWGWATNKKVVEEGGEKLEAVLDLMQIYTDNRYTQVAIQNGFTRVPVPVPEGTDLSGLHQIVQDYTALTDSASSVTRDTWYNVFKSSDFVTKVGMITQKLILNEITPEQGVQELETAYQELVE